MRLDETPTICFGETSMYSTSLAVDEAEVAADARSTRVAVICAGPCRRAGCPPGMMIGVALLVRTQPDDLVGHLAVLDRAVRRDQEAVLVDVGVDAETRRDETDVRAFRRLDRADAAVVRDVDVAHLEAGALSVETARAERREATLVRELRERVGLVDHLLSSPRPKKYSIAERSSSR